MSNINHKPSKYMLNLLHVLPPFVEEDVVNVIVEINPGTINKYEVITESGQLKLDRVGYSSLSYPFAYGAIPQTWDYDGDPLDVEIVNVVEPLVNGCLVEARVIGVMKFEDGGEVDDKIIAVLKDDRRSDHIKSLEDLGKQFKEETTYFWEHLKYLKKPGTGVTKGFFDKTEAIKVIKECEQRYKDIYAKNLEN
jgi:inorganic pyrophosphatase